MAILSQLIDPQELVKLSKNELDLLQAMVHTQVFANPAAHRELAAEIGKSHPHLLLKSKAS
jgi:hypothetical protein